MAGGNVIIFFYFIIFFFVFDIANIYIDVSGKMF
jgi:hypothetical protein